VEALISGDDLVGECAPGDEAPLLVPEHGAEGVQDEDPLHAGERDEALDEQEVGDDEKHPGDDAATGSRRGSLEAEAAAVAAEAAAAAAAAFESAPEAE